MSDSGNLPVRIGVLGCGAIAELFHLPALQQHPQTARSIVLAEPNPQRREAMQKKFAAATTVSDYRELEGRVDGVIVATPPSLHYAMTRWCLERSIPVLCEKPLTESIDEARQLVALAKERHTHLAVNQTRRLFPTYQKIRTLIAQGVLGELKTITYHEGFEFDWPAASPHHFQVGSKGVWSDSGVHLLDAVCFWLAAKPRLVKSWNDSRGGPEAIATAQFVHDACEIEIKVSRLGRLMNGFRIVGTLGTIDAESEDWDEFTVVFASGSRQRYPCGSNRMKYNDFAKPLIENFVQVIESVAEPVVSGASTLATTELLEEAYQRAQPYPMPWNRSLKELPSKIQIQTHGGSRPKRVLVTGAAGFVGGRVVEALAHSGWSTPVAAIRKWSRASRVAVEPIEIAILDILDPESVHRAMQGVDAVVHCAYTDDRASMVDGTRNMLEASLSHGIKNFVYLSSAEVYGPHRIGLVDETASLESSGRDYGDSKLEAEAVCRSFHERGLRPTLLRPSLIYGPFGSSWSIGVAERLQSGNWGLFEDFGEGIANLIYIDDLVQAICLALGNERSKGETYNVNGPHRPTWNQYFAAFNAALRLPPLQKLSPKKSWFRTRVMDAVGKVTGFAKSRFEDRLMEIYLRGGWASDWMKKLRHALKSTPSANELNDLYSRKAEYDDRRIQEQLGYAAAFSLEAGLQETVSWLDLHELSR